MQTYDFKVRASGGQNVYAVLTNRDGQFFDFADNTFKAFASCTTPTVAMTEQPNGGGGGNSHYFYAFDLALLPKRLTTKTYWAEAYVRAGGSNAPLTDRTVVDQVPFHVQASQLGLFPLGVEFCPAFTTTAGLVMRGILSVTRNGVTIDVHALDAAATLVVTAREFGSGVDHYETDPATVESAGWFEFEQSTPNYEDDTVYQHLLVVTVNGESVEFPVPLPNLG